MDFLSLSEDRAVPVLIEISFISPNWWSVANIYILNIDMSYGLRSRTSFGPCSSTGSKMQAHGWCVDTCCLDMHPFVTVTGKGSSKEAQTPINTGTMFCVVDTDEKYPWAKCWWLHTVSFKNVKYAAAWMLSTTPKFGDRSLVVLHCPCASFHSQGHHISVSKT